MMIDAPRLVHLTETDLNTKLDQTPRVMDLRLAEELGFEQPRKIRDLIDRHADALRQLAPLPTTTEKPSHRGGRRGTAYWLNKQQALYLCTKSETARATEATLLMVKVFDAYLGRKTDSRPLQPPEPPKIQRRPVSLLDVLREGFGAIMIDGKLVIFNADDFDLEHGAEAVVQGPGDVIQIATIVRDRHDDSRRAKRRMCIPYVSGFYPKGTPEKVEIRVLGRLIGQL